MFIVNKISLLGLISLRNICKPYIVWLNGNFLFLLVDLGLQRNGRSCKCKITLELYELRFEQKFIEETENYYMNESGQYLKDNSITEYMKKVRF